MLRTSFRFAGFDIPSGAACSCLAFAPLGAPHPRFDATVTMTLQNCALGSFQGGPPPIYALSAAPGGLPITARQPRMFNVIFEIGRAHVCIPVTNAQLVFRLLHE